MEAKNRCHECTVEDPEELLSRWHHIRVLHSRRVRPPPTEFEKIMLALQSTRVGYWYLELSSDTTEYSPRAAATLGYEGGESPPAGLLALVHRDDLEAVIAALEQNLQGLWPLDMECRLMNREGLYRWYRISADAHPTSDGQTRHLVGSIEDINIQHELRTELAETNARLLKEIHDRKHAEAELRHAQKLEAVGQLASGIAHEINTPMQFIGDSVVFLREAFGELLKLVEKYRTAVQEPLTEASRHTLAAEISRLEEASDLAFLLEEIGPALSRTEDGIGRVTTIVRAMKRFARPADRDMEPADINEAIASTLIVARNEYKYVADVITKYGSIPPVICHLGDLNQVFLNLIINAAHAIEDRTREGGEKGIIEIQTSSAVEGIQIEVSDTGCGIPDAIINRIWDPFFTTKKVGRGTGQGLAIARSIIVDKHRGELCYRAREGGGSVFVIRLPRDPKASTPIVSSASQESAPTPAGVAAQGSDTQDTAR